MLTYCNISAFYDELADGVGFEPTVGFPTPVFKTGSLNRSDTHPVYVTSTRYAVVWQGGGRYFHPASRNFDAARH